MRFAQLKEGLAYLALVERGWQIHGPTDDDFAQYVRMATDVCRLAAELADTPASKAAWHEARIRKFKEQERYVRMRVEVGAIVPQRLHTAAFARLQAEADLLALKAVADKPAPGGAAPPHAAPPALVAPAPPPVVSVTCVRAPAAVGHRLFRRR